MEPEKISTLAVKQQNFPLQGSAPSSEVDEDLSVKRKSSFEVEASSRKVDEDKVNTSLAVKLQSLSFQEGASNSKINDGDDLLVRQQNQVMFGGVPPTNLCYKTVVVRPILYGSKAWPLLVKKDDGHTHIWTVYLKPFRIEENISKFVKCVQFKLHESYANQIRICHAPPYQVIEKGCLEFEVEMEISFRDMKETPVTLFHSLKLSDGENDGNVNMNTNSVNSEFLHELIFEDPTPEMLKLLKHPKFQPGKTQCKIDYKEKKVGDLEKLTHPKSSFQGGASNIKIVDDSLDKNLSFQGGASNTKVNAWDDEINEGLSVRERYKIIFDEAPDASGRYKNVEVRRAIVYGSEVWPLCEERVDGHTHEWIVYVKPFINEDMSQFIKRVQFKLHETYEDQIRVCHAPPYQVTETGWGEFMLEIVIFFQDDNEEPVTIFHFLRFPDGEGDDGFANIKSEFYHELIFRNPTKKMLKLLKRPKLLPGEAQHKIDCNKKEVYNLKQLKQQKSSFKGVASKIKVDDKKVKEKLPSLSFQEGASESFSVREKNKVTLEGASAAKKKEVYNLEKFKQQKSSFKGVASKIKVDDKKVKEKLPSLSFQEGASESFSVREKNKVTLEGASAAKKKEVYNLEKFKQQKSSFKGVASKIKVDDKKVKLPSLSFQEGASESFSVREKNKVTLEGASAAKKKEVYNLEKFKQKKSSFKGVASKIKVDDKKVNEKLPSLSFQEGASESFSVRQKNKVTLEGTSAAKKKEVYNLEKFKQQKSSFKGVASKIKVDDKKVKLPSLSFQEGASESFSVREKNKVTLEGASAAKKKEVYNLEKFKQKKSSFKGVASKIKVDDKKVNEKLPSLSFQEGASESFSVRQKNKVTLERAPAASGRQKNVEVSRAIVYGSEVWPLGEKVDGVYTHQWTVYLKPFLNEDMSKFVKRVQFKLHESYANQIRVCYAPPYQVTEMGWGEFEMEIEIFFQDDKEKPVTLFHTLKFSDGEDNGNANMNTNPISLEFYDELIFRNPTKKMYELLKHPEFLPGEAQHKIDYKEKKARDLEKILAAKLNVKAEIAKAKAQLAYKTANIEELKTHVVDEHGTVILE